MDNFDLTPFCKTKAEATTFIAKLDAISAHVYETDFSLEKAVLKELGLQRKDKFLALMQENNVPSESPTDLQKFLQMVREKTAALPVLSLTLAFEPNEQTLETFSKWFLLNVKKQFLFDIQYNPELIAGATIGINGKFTDFSIKQAVNTLITNMLAQVASEKKQADAQNSSKFHNLEHIHLGR